MAVIDDTQLRYAQTSIQIVNPVGIRKITHAFHDIDGTHSLIRQWQPVMSLCIDWAMTCGLGDGFDSAQNRDALIDRVGQSVLPETDRFSEESAGFSALTQMEYGIRRGIELGHVPSTCLTLSEADRAKNTAIIKRIGKGQERFDDMKETSAITDFIHERTPRLFRLYEEILNKASRDKNTLDAWNHPEKWRVPGSMAFMTHLYDIGVKNYFVTGAVIYEEGGMLQEVQAVGFEVGSGKLVEELRGTSWDKKMPKDEVIGQLVHELAIDPAQVLIVGDGRSEIQAGVQMNAVTMSRLPRESKIQRRIQTRMGTNYILSDYTDSHIKTLIRSQA